MGQHGLVDGAAGKNTRGLNRGTAAFRRLDGTLAVDGVAEGVDDATQEGKTDKDIDNLTGTLNCVALLDETIAAEDGDTDIVGFQVEAHAPYTRREFHHLLCEHGRRLLVPSSRYNDEL